MYSPETNSRVRIFWRPFQSSTENIQIISTEIQTPAGLAAPEVPHASVKSITDNGDTVTIVLAKGPYVVVEPKPAPPKPTVWDFVPDYKRIMSKLSIGDLTVLPEFFQLQGAIAAAGLTVQQVAAASGSLGK